MFRDPRPFAALPQVTPPKPRRRLSKRQLFFAAMLCLLLLSGVIGTGSFVIHSLAASSPAVSPQAKLTLSQFLKQGRLDKNYHGSAILPKKIPAVPLSSKDHLADYSQLPPSAEPATMKPLSVALSASFVSGQAGTKSLSLVGSDKRLEVQLAAGALDLSQARIAGGAAPSGTLTLEVTQLHGHFAGQFNLLGSYTVQIVDGQQHPVSGIRLRHPLTVIYHYQPWELKALDLDPDHLLLTWPQAIAQALSHKQATSAFTSVMTNNKATHTLTAQTMAFGVGPFDVGGGDPQNQSPPIPHLGSVSGNAGQFTYGYPLHLPPGPGGFTPNVMLNYSSSGPNERHSRTSPAGPVGDGWSLSLGSISADNYPAAGSADPGTWYFVSGVGNVSDRLIHDTTITSGTYYQTEHISRLKIQQITSSITNQPCFNIWDTSGTYYQVSCTSDSLQYRTDASGRTNYRWDVNRIMAPNEGPGGTYKLIVVSYQQDSATTGGYTSIRDAAISKITYGYGTSVSSIGTVVGTVDFSYLAPPYSTNYNCSSAPPANTTLRCDDPVTFGTVTQPTVMSTLSLQSVTSYVGDDSASSHKAYGYSFTYQDTPYSTNCYDSYTLAQMACAGEHLLTSVTPSVYQNGTSHTLKQVVFGYTGALRDGYYDSGHTVSGGSAQYGGQTYWQYLNSYMDTATGVGGSVTYALAYNNTHGTPYVINGDGSVDDRHDPLYCTRHSDCIGNYNHADDRAWSEQVVTQLTSSGADSSSVQPASTVYNYRLAVTGTYSGTSTDCYPATGSNPPPGQSDCVGDDWIPAHNGTQDSDWRDYFHSEFRGFNAVYVTSPANDLTANYYYSTEGWGTPSSNSGNSNSGQLYEQDIYAGNAATSSALQQQTTNTYALNPNSCNGQLDPVYNPCEAMVLTSRTTLYDGTGSGNSNAPWVQHDYAYDDFSSRVMVAPSARGKDQLCSPVAGRPATTPTAPPIPMVAQPTSMSRCRLPAPMRWGKRPASAMTTRRVRCPAAAPTPTLSKPASPTATMPTVAAITRRLPVSRLHWRRVAIPVSPIPTPIAPARPMNRACIPAA